MRAKAIRIALAAAAITLAAGAAKAEPAARFDETGRLSLPENYREWVFLGATNPDFRHSQD